MTTTPADLAAKARQLVDLLVQENIRADAILLAAEAVRVINELAATREPEGKMADSFVQPVPDKCDRIVWRNRYLHLPDLSEAVAICASGVAEGWKRLLELASEEYADAAASVQHGANRLDVPEWARIVAALATPAASDRDSLVPSPSAQPAEPKERKPLTEWEIDQGRCEIFSTSNPFCPCDSKTMLKAVRWAERAHGIQEQPKESKE